MFLEKERHIHFYNDVQRELYVTEFGHSVLTYERKVGPYVRDVWLLHIVIRDICRFCEFDVMPGEGVLIAKGRVHSFQVSPGYEHFWLAFDGPGASALQVLFGLDMSAHQHLQLQMDTVALTDMLRAAFEQGAGPGGERRATALVLSLLAHLAPEAETGSGYVRSACSFMQHNYHRRVSMAEVARAINVSEKYLCRLFNRELGTTPQKYLIGLRMQQARTLLETTDLRVKDVAATVGYPSQLAFSSAFSAHWGMSPTDARKNARQEAQELSVN